MALFRFNKLTIAYAAVVTAVFFSVIACGFAEESENHPFGFAGPYPPDDFNKIKELGVKYARVSIAWDKIEIADNQFIFEMKGKKKGKKDKYQVITTKYNLEPIVRLKLGQGWATKPNKSIKCGRGSKGRPDKSADFPPKDLGAWSSKGYSPLLYDFTYKTLKYIFENNRPVEFIVVGNEVNTPVFWHGTTQEYLKTRTTVYKAVNDFNAAFNKDVKVVDSGLAGLIWGMTVIREIYCSGRQEEALAFARRYFRRSSFRPTEEEISKRCSKENEDYILVKEIFKKDPNLGKPSFDCMSYHFYEPWETQEEIIKWIKEEMKKNGYQRPIMNTEGGFCDRARNYGDSPTLAKEVADDVIKLHVVALAEGVKTWLWLPFTERYKERHYGPQWKGLVLPDQTDLPAFTSYKVMVQKLDGFTKAEKLNNFSSAYVYKFIVCNKPVYVAWSDKPVAVDFQLELSGEVKVTEVTMASDTTDSRDIRLTTSPIFVEK